MILFTAAVRIRLLNTPLERDEGEYAYAGQLMLHGIPPYQLAFNMKFPGTYAAYAAIMSVLGQTIVGIHLGFLLLNAGTIVLVYLLGERLFTPAAGVASAAAYALLSLGEGVLGTQAQATHFVMGAALGGTLLLLRSFDTPSFDTRWSSTLLWSGVLFGIAVLMKQHAVLFVAFGIFCLVWDSLTHREAGLLAMVRRLAFFLAGVFAPLLLTFLVLWRVDVFSKFWFWTVTYAREYALEQTFSDGMASLGSVFPKIVGPNAAIWWAALVGFLLLWWRKAARTHAVPLTAFLVSSFLAVCPGFYFREHYFVLLLPAVALLAGATIYALEQWSRSASLTYGLYAVALLISVFQQKEYLFQMSPFEVSRAMYGMNPFPEAIQIGSYIRAHSAKGSRIAVVGSEPEILFYADRPSATGYIYTYGLMENQPYAVRMQNEMIRDLEASRPEYVVFVDVITSWLPQANASTRILEWWHAYAMQNYKAVGVADIFSADHTEYRWDNVETYNPGSHPVIWIYKRNGI